MEKKEYELSEALSLLKQNAELVFINSNGDILRRDLNGNIIIINKNGTVVMDRGWTTHNEPVESSFNEILKKATNVLCRVDHPLIENYLSVVRIGDIRDEFISHTLGMYKRGEYVDITTLLMILGLLLPVSGIERVWIEGKWSYIKDL